MFEKILVGIDGSPASEKRWPWPPIWLSIIGPSFSPSGLPRCRKLSA